MWDIDNLDCASMVCLDNSCCALIASLVITSKPSYNSLTMDNLFNLDCSSISSIEA